MHLTANHQLLSTILPWSRGEVIKPPPDTLWDALLWDILLWEILLWLNEHPDNFQPGSKDRIIQFWINIGEPRSRYCQYNYQTCSTPAPSLHPENRQTGKAVCLVYLNL